MDVEDREEPANGSWDRRRGAGWDEFRAARARLRELLARQAGDARGTSDDEPSRDEPPEEEPPAGEEDADD